MPTRTVRGGEGNWVEMQTNTFTNWVNQNLKLREMEIEDLETGFQDGTKLINLYEVVAKKNLGRYHKNPRMPSQKFENVSLVLRSMEEDGIKLVSIDNDHIVNGNLKLILGLIWRMILHYQIGASEGGKGVKLAAKKLLLLWLQNVIPDQEIHNLTNNWNSGIALCALVDTMEPGLCPEYRQMRRENSLFNIRKGMQLAEEKLGIPPVISAEYMASPDVDELSMMTYLSYFTQDDGVGERWTLKLVNEWNEKLNVQNFNTDWNDGVAMCSLVNTFTPGLEVVDPELDESNKVANISNAMNFAEARLGVPKIVSAEELTNPEIPEIAVMAYVVQFRKIHFRPKLADAMVASGAGITEPTVNKQNEFYVRSEENVPWEDLEVTVSGPLHGGMTSPLPQIPVRIDRTHEKLATCRYHLGDPGNYVINIIYQGEHIPRSPFSVMATRAIDLNAAKVRGDEYKSAIVEDRKEFTIDIGDPTAEVDVRVEDTHGGIVPSSVVNNHDGSYTMRYTPTEVGSHQMWITVDGERLPLSPLESHVSDPSQVAVTQSSQDQQLYAEIYERIGIAVDTTHSGPGSLSARTSGPESDDIPTEVIQEKEGSYTVSFTPKELGEYRSNVFWNDHEIQGSPFIVWVSDPSKCVAHGEALYQARLGEPSQFEVTTMGAGPGTIYADIETDTGNVPIEVQKIDENTFKASYEPNSLDDLFIHLRYNNIPLRGSPYSVMVGDPSKVHVSYETSELITTGSKYGFMMTMPEGSGRGDMSCTVNGPHGEVPCDIIPVSSTKKEVSFVPSVPGIYEVKIYYAGKMITGCPFMIEVVSHQVADATKVVATGEGLKRATVNETTNVMIDTTKAGQGRLTAKVQGLKAEAPAGITDNHDGTYTLSYTPPAAGAYVMYVKFNDDNVPGSPFKLTAYSRADPNLVVVNGSGLKEGTAGQPVIFELDGRQAGPGQLTCRCRAPSGNETYVLINDNKDGTYTVDLNAVEPGLHNVDVQWDGQPIPGSPFYVRIMQAPDVKKVKAYGPGLRDGILRDYEGNFHVETKGAGPGTLKVRIHGPKGSFKVEMQRENTKLRTINVTYNPTDVGYYTVHVFWTDDHVPGSPFEIAIGRDREDLQRLVENKKPKSKSNGVGGYRDERM